MFPFRKKNREKDLLLVQAIEQLSERLDSIEMAMTESMNRKLVETIHIEKVVLDKPTLEQLTLKLESLDIEELSGALNIGNNFGITVDKKEKEEETLLPFQTSKKQTDKSTNQQEVMSINKTKKGYSFTFDTENS
ncbi:hypothetical protein [Alkalihalobacillus sp. LMS39]|uniref:hypothetical protein n=1 Tax=Alkalihalobacillus sp. LMS39 TaxID=2924032 RepID=UPI001FB54FCF|nr:hypothetical protein [Alkalihalobacillus sp. LMS39]UOE92147.1 hypothetical protein MM271_12830 [Alkalihalobacillus sp. LMS39]